MDAERLADGLWRWTAAGVGCVYYEALDAIVLFDPVLPTGEEERFLAHLDRDVERLGLPVSILLTDTGRKGSAAALRERYGADDRVPASVEAHPLEGAPEQRQAYLIRPHRALVVPALVGLPAEVAELPVALVLVASAARGPAPAGRGSSGR